MNSQQTPTWYTPAPQKPKSSKGKKIAMLAGGIFAVLVVGGAISRGGDKAPDAAAPLATSAAKPAAPAKPAPAPKHKTTYATFKVWGTAPADDFMGPMSVSYGSGAEDLKGELKNGKFEARLPVKKGQDSFHVSAFLWNSGDIRCSVTVDGKTDEVHAAGEGSSCYASMSRLFGDWS